MLGRRAAPFVLQQSGEWPDLVAHGLPSGGLSLIHALRVAVDHSHWWLKFFGLATLSVEYKAGDGQRVAHVFVGPVQRVEQVEGQVSLAMQAAFKTLGERLAGFVDAFELDKGRLFQSARFVRHTENARLLTAHDVLRSDETRRLVHHWQEHPLHAPTPSREELDVRINRAYEFLRNPAGAREVHNREFVNEQRVQYASFFDKVEESPLTPRQVEASLHFDDANVTVAAAGSGKTSVMVSKVGYALASGMLKDREILVLAFNKAAARELRDRITENLGRVLGRQVSVQARTFHSLGLALWMKRQRELALPGRPRLINFQDSDEDAAKDAGKVGALKGKRLIKTLLIEMAEQADTSFSEAVMTWATRYRYPTPELDPSDDETLDERQTRYEQLCKRIARRRDRPNWMPPIPTFAHDLWVRSNEEARLANWLLLRNVPFTYEKNAPIWLRDKVNEGLPQRQQVEAFRPDFTYPNPQDERKSFFHEHFGLDKQGRAPSFLGQAYEQRANHKRTVLTKALRSNIAGVPSRFIQTTSAQFADATIFEHLERELRLRGIPVGDVDRQRWDNSLKALLEEDSLVQLVADFIVAFKDAGLTMAELEARVGKLHTPERLRVTSFLAWIKPFLVRLQERMTQGTGGERPRPLMDFAGMIGGAVSALSTWQPGTLPFKLILVDEFQDISRLRAQLVQGLLDQHPDQSMLYCVGDDWQSINRFAGSDVGIFRRVHDGLSADSAGSADSPIEPRWTAQSMLERTFRCPQGIADVARWFVMESGKNSVLIDKPVESNKPRKTAVVRVVEHGDSGDERLAALEDQLQRIVDLRSTCGEAGTPATVFILTRNRQDTSLPEGITGREIHVLARRFSRRGLTITHHSMHGSKGLGADYVLLVGMDSGRRGYPSDYWDDPLIDVLRPLRRHPYEEERRLFYVGMTRAKIEVTVLCVGARPSPFVVELEGYPESGVVVFERLPGAVRYSCPKCKLGWAQRRGETGRVECTRTPWCGLADSTHRYPDLPPARVWKPAAVR